MIRNIIINKQEGSKYAADDIPEKVLRWLENNKRYTEEERPDIIEGQVVVVLKGQYTSLRGVVVKRLPKNLLLVSGPSKINGMAFTVVNQRFVHPVSVFVPLKGDFISSIEVKEKEISEIRDWTTENAVDLEILDLLKLDGKQQVIDSAIEKECAGVKGLRSYFKTPFTLPKNVDPMSAFY
ncbi:large subunit ribosomal protein L6e [Nematocida major]|uniref:large subunit ribosomal protein L6e n=1 Tax=Nematocida major TaxID=1912982 RepID=UPI0020089C58|nr:large subunit ribosomal protein L6e [Nematocida major]KAH9387280.1 large subunit ribosomal protein L6e [Nematocida major]